MQKIVAQSLSLNLPGLATMSLIDAARRTLLLGCALGLPLGGCSTVGPVSIDQARTPYNEVIQNTSEQQTLLNLVRVHSAETPLFMDVTEVDAVTTAHVELTGTESGLGSFQRATGTSGPMGGSMGSIGGTASYEESPTVRYQPLLGAALVAQVGTPVSATSLVNLYNSDWPLGSIFDLTVKRFTPGFDDYHAALDALMVLDRYGGIVLEAKPRERSPSELKNAGVSVSMGQAPDKNDADLLIYFRPERLRVRFRGCDDGTTTEEHKTRKPEQDRTDRDEAQRTANNLWSRVQQLFASDRNPIVIPMKSGPDHPSKSKSVINTPAIAPLLQTRSALGMLNSIAAGDNIVMFVSKEIVDRTIDQSLDKKGYCHSSFYRVSETDTTEQPPFDNRIFTSIDGLKQGQVLSASELDKERRFGDEQRLILVEVTDVRPANAFVSVFHDHQWYSIQDRDLISKRNLALVAQIATIQAVPPQTPQLTPTINVGSR